MRQLQGQRVSTCGIRVLAGFGLRVEKSGTKTFIVRYRADGGGRTAPRRFATIGRFGPLTVDEARRRARVLLGAVATGEDPAGQRQARRREMTIAALVNLYEAEGCFVQRGVRQGEPMKARTKAYTVARLRHHVVPLLGHKRVTEVGPGEIERFGCCRRQDRARREDGPPNARHRPRRGWRRAQSGARPVSRVQFRREARASAKQSLRSGGSAQD